MRSPRWTATTGIGSLVLIVLVAALGAIGPGQGPTAASPGASLGSVARSAADGAPALVGQVGGRAGAVARNAENGLLCLAVGPRVLLLDVTGPADARLVGQTEVLDDVVTAVACHGDRIFAGGSAGSLWEIDARDRASPWVRWQTSLSVQVADLAAIGDRLYVVSGAVLAAFDTAQPGEARALGVRPLPQRGTGVAAADGLVAVTWGTGRTGGLLLLSSAVPLDGEPLAELELSDAAQDVALGDALAYVLEKNALRVVDLARPDAPAVIGSLPHREWASTPYGNRLVVADGLAYLAVGMVIDAASDDLAIDGGVEIVDVREPSRPRSVGHYDLSPGRFGNGCADVALDGGRAWVLDPAMGLTAIDVSKPEVPRAVGGFPTAGVAFDVAVHGDRAYVAGGWGLRELDLDDPSAPGTAGFEPSVGAQTLVEISGGTLFASRYGFFLNRTRWRPLVGAASGGRLDIAVNDVAHADGIAYVVGARPKPDGLDGLTVYNLRDASRPVKLAGLPLVGSRTGEAVALAGDIAFVTDGDALHRVDVSRPNQPVETGPPLGSPAARRVAVTGDRVVVAGEGLAVVDASDPSGLRLLGTLQAAPGSWNAMDLAVDGATGFMLRRGALDIVDLADPTRPRVRTSVALPAYAAALALTPTHVVVAGGAAGLYVFRRTEGPESSPTPAPSATRTDPRVETRTPTAGAAGSTAHLPFVLRDGRSPAEQPTATHGPTTAVATATRAATPKATRTEPPSPTFVPLPVPRPTGALDVVWQHGTTGYWCETVTTPITQLAHALDGAPDFTLYGDGTVRVGRGEGATKLQDTARLDSDEMDSLLADLVNGVGFHALPEDIEVLCVDAGWSGFFLDAASLASRRKIPGSPCLSSGSGVPIRMPDPQRLHALARLVKDVDRREWSPQPTTSPTVTLLTAPWPYPFRGDAAPWPVPEAPLAGAGLPRGATLEGAVARRVLDALRSPRTRLGSCYRDVAAFRDGDTPYGVAAREEVPHADRWIGSP